MTSLAINVCVEGSTSDSPAHNLELGKPSASSLAIKAVKGLLGGCTRQGKNEKNIECVWLKEAGEDIAKVTSLTIDTCVEGSMSDSPAHGADPGKLLPVPLLQYLLLLPRLLKVCLVVA
ncbi:hypothetical protein PISMIDRAFT_19999 [Pisolithus microcarpus 441]|uniref:Uncharacterized protein n=1 Tax=Pisolithus microcarpus 441 TaxID=765257 RepID=A0A0C9YSC8_9AGAM|nr:hypothetical protein BKA83DRAFT_19999 [Pisolithus microcarpus]KIK10878.1 hypothetical protein PISMIDRAFT_19999 [Pisolithus microcarpus 441]